MKAMVINEFGGPDVFKEQNMPKPSPKENEVLVQVHATSVNPVDYKLRKNGTWANLKLPIILGADIAGVIEEVGPGVKDLKVGDEVFYTPELFNGKGSYAEYHVAHESIVALKPKNISFEEAAGIPLAGCTAWDALISSVKIQVGETILIHAGAGGVGSIAIQIAKAAGAKVFTTCGDYNDDFVKSLGADVIIDYRNENYVDVVNKETDGKGVDAVFDTVGGDTFSRSIEITRPHGRLVGIVNTDGNLNKAYRKNLSIHFNFLERENPRLYALKRLIEQEKLKPLVDSIMPLEKVGEAHAKLEKGGVKGKIILTTK